MGDSGLDMGKMLGDEDDFLLVEDDFFDDGDFLLLDDGDISFDFDFDFEDSDLVFEEDFSGEVVLSVEDSGINLSFIDSGFFLDEEVIEFEGLDIDVFEFFEDEDMIEIDGEMGDLDVVI